MTSYNPFSLEGKTILVTGASSGIGRATAIECSKMGATVIITGRNTERLAETFNQLEGDDHTQVALNLQDTSQFDSLLNTISEINGVVHSAGIVKMVPFQFINREELKTVFMTNFVAPSLLTQQLIKTKKLGKGSSIVFVSSTDGTKICHAGNSMYASSKGAITAMAHNMALDLAPKKIRVNCVLPGTVDTPIIHTENVTEEQLEENKKYFPLKRFGHPEDIAYGIIYLLSDASNWVTGTDLVIDGGFTLQ
jgi:NAD(P)-dependent dehydrogenase (short-subunit alcohol dehydrogenase family)